MIAHQHIAHVDILIRAVGVVLMAVLQADCKVAGIFLRVHAHAGDVVAVVPGRSLV